MYPQDATRRDEDDRSLSTEPIRLLISAGTPADRHDTGFMIIVTGGAGMIGSNIVAALNAEGR